MSRSSVARKWKTGNQFFTNDGLSRTRQVSRQAFEQSPFPSDGSETPVHLPITKSARQPRDQPDKYECAFPSNGDRVEIAKIPQNKSGPIGYIASPSVQELRKAFDQVRENQKLQGHLQFEYSKSGNRNNALEIAVGYPRSLVQVDSNFGAFEQEIDNSQGSLCAQSTPNVSGFRTSAFTNFNGIQAKTGNAYKVENNRVEVDDRGVALHWENNLLELDAQNDIISRLAVTIHANTLVDEKLADRGSIYISHAYCAAIRLDNPVANGGLCRLYQTILLAAYEATLLAGVLNYVSGGSNRVFLTALGATDKKSQVHLIQAAIETVLEDFADLDLRVTFVDPTETNAYSDWGKRRSTGIVDDVVAVGNRRRTIERFPDLAKQLKLQLPNNNRQSCYIDSVLAALFTDPSYYLQSMWRSLDNEFGHGVRELRESMVNGGARLDTCDNFRRLMSRFEGGEFNRDVPNDPGEFLSYLLARYGNNSARVLQQNFKKKDGMFEPCGIIRMERATIFSTLSNAQVYLSDSDIGRGVIESLGVLSEESKFFHETGRQTEPMETKSIRKFMVNKWERVKRLDIAGYDEPLGTSTVIYLARVLVHTPYVIILIDHTAPVVLQRGPRVGDGEFVSRFVDVLEHIFIGGKEFRFHAAVMSKIGHYTCWFQYGRDHKYYRYDDALRNKLIEIGDFKALKAYKEGRVTLDTHANILFYSPIRESREEIDAFFAAA